MEEWKMKKKFLAGMLAMSIMFMGAGYAAWTQSFTVTNTVETGELRFDYAVNSEAVGTQNKYTDFKVEKNAEGQIVGTIEKAYPGAEYSYDIEMTNHSTMGVKPVFTKFVSTDDTNFKALDYQIEYFVDGEPYTEGQVVEPKQNLKASIKMTIPTSADEETLLENGKVTFTNTLTFNQFNAK